MKKILIQYLLIFVATTSILFLFTWASVACEKEQIEETLPLCEEFQVSTEENPCRKDNVSINSISEALEKLGQSGTLPK